MAAEVVESLELVIQTRAESAKEGIDKLATSVSDFGKAVEGYLDSLYSFSDVLKNISEAAKGLKGVQNIKSIVSAVKSASASGKVRSGVGKVMAEAVSGQGATKVWKPVVPPTKASSTVKGKTRNVAWNGGVYQYNETADEIAKNLNKSLSGTYYSNKDLSSKVQEIRQLLLNGMEVQAMQMAKSLAEELASSAGQKSVHPLIERMNSAFSGYGGKYIGVDEKDIGGTGMNVGEMNALLRSMGARFGIRMNDRSNASIRGIDEFEDALGEHGISANVEDLFYALKGNWTGHGAALNERRTTNDSELTQQVFGELLDSISSWKEIDTEAPARAANEAVEAARKAKEEAQQAAQYAKEAEAAWKQFESEEKAANKEYAAEHKITNKEQFWKQVARNAQRYERAEAGPDNTASEVAGWNESEDEKLLAYQEDLAEGWKQYAEEVVADHTVVGSSIKDIIENVTGLNRATKDAEDSARAMMDAMSESTPFKSAKESARAMVSEMEAAGRKSNREYFDALAAKARAKEEGIAEEENARIKAALELNTPEKIRQKVDLNGVEKFQAMSNIPGLANEGLSAGLIDENTANAMMEAAGYAVDTRDAISDAANESQSIAGGISEANQDMTGLGDSARITAEEFVKNVSQADILQMKLAGVSQKLEEAINADKQDSGKIARLTTEYQNMKEKLEEVGDAANDASDNASGLGTALSNAANSIKSGTFGKLASQLWRVAKMRGLRYIIRSISSAISGGVTNLYSWSDGVNGSFADAMDTYSTKLSLIKNSVPTAFSPLIEQAVPYISQLTSYVYSACNALSQFWALLTGSDTWTKALETTKKWSDTTKKGAGSVSDAADDTKDLLADWDELNIIQSDTTDSSSSGSSGSGSSVDYSKMFEDTSKFDTWTKYFTDIKEIVLDIATALLGWKLSKVLTGALSTISSFVFAGATIKLVFDASTFFDNMYVDTGEEGWLVADLLTTILGSELATKALSSVLGGAAASIAVPLTFAVSAAATIKTLIDRTDVSALSEKSLKLSALAAIEAGTAAGYLFHTGPFGLLTSIGVGAGTALWTFGVAIGLKAVASTVDTKKITEETLAADILSAFSTGTGVILSEIALGGETVTAFTLGSGVALATFGVLLGIEAVYKSIGMGQITKETLIEDSTSALTFGTGLGLIGYTAAGLEITDAIILAGGGFLASFGLMLGIEAVYESVKTGEITKETLLKDLISSLALGIGLGVTFGGSLLIGGAAAIATFGVLVGLEMVLKLDDEEPITWGNYIATEDEVKAFVNEKVFKTNPSIRVSLLNASVSDVKLGRENLKKKISDTLQALDVLRVTITTDNLQTLKDDVFGKDGLIDQFKTYAENQKTLIRTTFKFALKEEDGTDSGKAGESAKKVEQGWAELEGIMTELGNNLTKEFDKAFKESLEGSVSEDTAHAIAEITQMMTDISNAVTYGQEMAKISQGMDEFLGGMSHKTAQDIIDYYEEQRDAIIKAKTEAIETSAESSLELHYAYTYLADKEENQTKKKEYETKAKEFYAEYMRLMESAKEQAEEEALDELTDSKVIEKIREEMLKRINKHAEGDDWSIGLQTAGIDFFGLTSEDTLEGILKEYSEFENPLEEAMKTAMTKALEQAYGEDNAKTYLQYLEDGILQWSDLFDSDSLASLMSQLFDQSGASNEFRTEFEQWFRKTFGIDEGIEIEVPVKAEPETPYDRLWWKKDWQDSKTKYLEEKGYGNSVEVPVKPEVDGADKLTSDDIVGGAAMELSATLQIDDIEYGEDFDDELGMQYWNDGPDTVNTSSFTNPDDGVTVDAQTSGMALDSTIQMTGSNVGIGLTNLSNLLEALKKTMANVEEYTKRTANKDFSVNITPSSAFGFTSQRSNRNVETVTGNPP